MAKERRQYEELRVQKEHQYEVQRHKYEEGFWRKLWAYNKFHDKVLQDQKTITRRLSTSSKKIKEAQENNGVSN